MTSRPAAGGGRWVSVSPERLQRWLDGLAARHGHVGRTAQEGAVRLTAQDGAVAEVVVPFPPLEGGLVEHVMRDRRVGVLLVRLGGCAVGVFDGARLVSSKVTTPLQSRLHPCSGWLLTTRAASWSGSSAAGQVGEWGHMSGLQARVRRVVR